MQSLIYLIFISKNTSLLQSDGRTLITDPYLIEILPYKSLSKYLLSDIQTTSTPTYVSAATSLVVFAAWQSVGVPCGVREQLKCNLASLRRPFTPRCGASATAN
jgi:hypothetical protein